MGDTYHLGRPYQVRLLALCLREGFVEQHRDVLDPRYFDDDVHQDVARVVLAFADKWRRPPDEHELQQALDDLADASPKGADRRKAYNRAVGEIDAMPLGDECELVERIVTFARTQAMAQAILAAADDVSRGDVEGASRKVEEARQVGLARGDLGLDYFEDDSHIDDDRALDCVSTGIQPFDDLLDGGLAVGELGVLEGPPGRFKSGALVNFGSAALRKGFDVVHVSLELARNRVARRYNGALLGGVLKRDGSDKLRAMLAKAKQELDARLFIQYWSLNSATLPMIEGYLHSLQRAKRIGERRLLLIVDGPYAMRASREYERKTDTWRENYASMIGLADRWKCPVWTSIHSNRGSVNKGIIGIQDLAECFAVAADAHVIASLCQTKEEEEDDRLRLFVAKCREAESFREVEMLVDYTETRFSPARDISAAGRQRKPVMPKGAPRQMPSWPPPSAGNGHATAPDEDDAPVRIRS